MTRDTHRQSVPDRARRRAIRAYAARLGVPYSVAARLLKAQTARPLGRYADVLPTTGEDHRAWLFALRESRRFDLRVRDTRLAADLPLGRAAHLTDRFPALRGTTSLYDGEDRQTVLAMLYAVVAFESPAVVPSPAELSWVAELGEETAVDTACSELDRAARLLLDQESWRLWTRVEAALAAGLASGERRVRDAATGLDRELRSVVLRHSLDGARQTLDAVLTAAFDGHAPGTRVRIAAGQHAGRTGTVVGAHWQPAGGPPTGYEIRTDPETVTVSGADIATPD